MNVKYKVKKETLEKISKMNNEELRSELDKFKGHLHYSVYWDALNAEAKVRREKSE